MLRHLAIVALEGCQCRVFGRPRWPKFVLDRKKRAAQNWDPTGLTNQSTPNEHSNASKVVANIGEQPPYGSPILIFLAHMRPTVTRYHCPIDVRRSPSSSDQQERFQPIHSFVEQGCLTAATAV